jgi:hypothetical protein
MRAGAAVKATLTSREIRAGFQVVEADVRRRARGGRPRHLAIPAGLGDSPDGAGSFFESTHLFIACTVDVSTGASWPEEFVRRWHLDRAFSVDEKPPVNETLQECSF